MPLSESPNAQAIRELGELQCPACKEPKKRGRSFCSRCYYRLPENVRLALYRTFGDGYLDAYEDAKDFLRGQ